MKSANKFDILAAGAYGTQLLSDNIVQLTR